VLTKFKSMNMLLLLLDMFQGMSTEELNGGPIHGPCRKVWSGNQN